MSELDIALFRALNGAGTTALEPLMHALSWLGHYWRMPFYAAGLAAIAALCWGSGRRDAGRAIGMAAWILTIGFAVAAPLTAALKQALALSRPAAALADVHVFSAADSEFSFPSGHAVFAGLLVASLWPTLPLWGRFAAAAVAVGVAVSRVWLGAHFPSDVGTGLLIGIAAASWVGWLVRRVRADRSTGVAFGLSTLVLALDAATKTAIAHLMALGERIYVSEFFNIVHWRNTGAAFSFLHDAGGWQRSFFILLALAISTWLAREIVKRDTALALKLAYGLVLGGALANVFDRAFRGAVVDWLDFHWAAHHWPAFNVADSAISAGVALLLLQSLFQRRQAPRHGPKREEPRRMEL